MLNINKVNNLKLYLLIIYVSGLIAFVLINFHKPEFNWLLTRFTGIISFILLSMGICFGLSISTKSAYIILRPPFALQLHTTINILSLFTVTSHFSSLLIYKYGAWNLFEILIPFFIKRSYPTENGFDYTFSVASGITAFYIILILVISSLLRSKISIKLWRKIHYLSFFCYFSFVVHGFTAGSSSNLWWMRLIYIISILSVLILTFIRIKKVIYK